MHLLREVCASNARSKICLGWKVRPAVGGKEGEDFEVSTVNSAGGSVTAVMMLSQNIMAQVKRAR